MAAQNTAYISRFRTLQIVKMLTLYSTVPVTYSNYPLALAWRLYRQWSSICRKACQKSLYKTGEKSS